MNFDYQNSIFGFHIDIFFDIDCDILKQLSFMEVVSWCIMSGPPVLLGDSIFRRLFKHNPTLFDDLSDRLCVSGCTVTNLLSLIVDSRQQLKGRKVIVLIGANDIYRKVKTPVSTIKSKIVSIVRLLRNLKCAITWCEILPIPRLGRNISSAPSVLEINSLIRSFEPAGVTVIHSHDVFCDSKGVIKRSLFYTKLGNTSRVDLVHPNREGLSVLLLTLEV